MWTGLRIVKPIIKSGPLRSITALRGLYTYSKSMDGLLQLIIHAFLSIVILFSS
jgi:hypothetical protein